MLFQAMDPNSKIIKIDFCDVITLELYYCIVIKTYPRTLIEIYYN